MDKQVMISIRMDTDTLDRLFHRLLPILVLCQMLAIFLINLLKADQELDYDSALALRHAVEMWKNQTLALPGFSYFSTLETDNAVFFAAPFYLLTGALGLWLGICHAVLYLLSVFVLCDIFQNLGCKRECGLMAALLIFTPYRAGQLDWANMLFFEAGQYTFRVLSMLLVLDCLLLPGRGRPGTCRKVLLPGLALVMVFWTSLSCGNYILLMVLFPAVLWLAVRAIRKEGLLLDIRQTLFLAANSGLALAGWRLHDWIAGASINNTKNLIAAQSFIDNIGRQITGVFLLLGGLVYDQPSIFSAPGLLTLIRFAFALFSIGFFCWYVARGSASTAPLTQFCACIALVNLAVLFRVDTLYGSPIAEYRYHILWTVCTFLCVALLPEVYRALKFGKLLVSALAVALVLINAGGFFSIFKMGDVDALAKEILQTADTNGCDVIYLYNMPTESHQIRALDLDKSCLSFTCDNGTFQCDTGDFYPYAADNAAFSARNLLVIPGEAFTALPAYCQSGYQLVGTTTDARSVYVGEKNPFDFVSGLPFSGIAVDYVYSQGYGFTGECTNSGFLARGADDYVLVGPNTQTRGGVYNVTLYYTPLNGQAPNGSRAEIILDGDRQVAAAALPPDGLAELKNVALEDGGQFQLRVWAAQGDAFYLDQIVMEKVK